jgi:hypothetical protein
VFGSLDDSLRHSRDAFHEQPNSATTQTANIRQSQEELISREWNDLPYAMMSLTAAGRSWDGNRLYWRDQNVQLGEVDLNLIKTHPEDDSISYKASYGTEEFRRDFPLQPSMKHDQLLWSAPGICDTAKLSSAQLAEKLLSKLVTFYTCGMV